MRTQLRAAFAVAFLAATPCLAAPADDVPTAFREFEALNATLAAEQGCECRALQAQEDLARYADGPLAGALEGALEAICGSANGAMLQALFGVTLATADTSADAFTGALAHAFACQRALVGEAIAASSPEQRATLLDLLSVGVENAAPADIDGLRAQLHSLAIAAD